MLRSTHALLLASAAALAGCPGGSTTPPGPATPPDLVANGAVHAIAVAPDGTAYLGGSFTAVGPYTGQLVVLDPATGALAAPAPGFTGSSRSGGFVSAAAPDGHGGWYVGGSFAPGAGAAFASLVRVRADGSLDPSFVTSFDGSVDALAVADGVVYVGGAFEQVGGAARHRLAAVDVATGAVTAWDPTADASAIPALARGVGPRRVNALAVGDGVLYAAGVTWNGEGTLGWLAAVDPAGAVSTWRPAISGRGVNALAVRAGTLYLGGDFGSVDGAPRAGLAAFDPSGVLSTWDPGASTVTALAVLDGVLYAGGRFRYVPGEPAACAVAFDEAGVPSRWNPRLDAPALAFAASGGKLYVGGGFRLVGGVRRPNLAAFDASGALLPWDAGVNDDVSVLSVSGGRLLAAGALTSAGAVSRSGVAALDPRGALLPWDPDVDGTRSGGPAVRALALAGDRLYVGGGFETVGGAARANLAAVDLQGHVLDVTPAVDGPVYALATFGAAVHAGGDFRNAGGLARASLLAFDPAAAGSVLAFDPGLVGTRGERPVVFALAARGPTLYAGGRFTRAGTAPRGGGAAFDAHGTLLPWDPGVEGVDALLFPVEIQALAPTDRGVYVGGTFSSLGGAARTGIGRVDGATGTAQPWNPAVTDSVTTFGLLPLGDTVYVGGRWIRPGAALSTVTAVDAANGTVARWNPGNRAYAYALAARGAGLLVGDTSGFRALAP